MGLNCYLWLLLISFSHKVSHYFTLTAESFSNTDSKLAGTYSVAHISHILCDHANSHIRLLIGFTTK